VNDYAYPKEDPRFLCEFPEESEEKEFKVQALFDYNGEEESELSFRESDIIVVYENVGNGWLRGSLNGKEGFIPEGFVERI